MKIKAKVVRKSEYYDLDSKKTRLLIVLEFELPVIGPQRDLEIYVPQETFDSLAIGHPWTLSLD